jgi:hypothetical protein
MDTDQFGPNYEKYAKVVINNLHNKGIDFASNPDAIEDEAEEVAEMLVLNVDKLTEAARAEANSYQMAGVIQAGGQ